MIRESAVRLAIYADHLTTHLPTQLRCEQSIAAVAGIDHNLELLTELHALFDRSYVIRSDLHGFHAALAIGKLARLDDLIKLLNLLAVDRPDAHVAVGMPKASGHFEAVVFARIVTAGDHHAAIGLVVHDGEIFHRR